MGLNIRFSSLSAVRKVSALPVQKPLRRWKYSSRFFQYSSWPRSMFYQRLLSSLPLTVSP